MEQKFRPNRLCSWQHIQWIIHSSLMLGCWNENIWVKVLCYDLAVEKKKQQIWCLASLTGVTLLRLWISMIWSIYLILYFHFPSKSFSLMIWSAWIDLFELIYCHKHLWDCSRELMKTIYDIFISCFKLTSTSPLT